MRSAIIVAAIAAAAVAACRDLPDAQPAADAAPDADPLYPYPPPRTDVVPAIGSDTTLEIATWNLENFPAIGATPELVADLIASLDLDVIVVEEIANVLAWDELLTRLRDYDGVLSSHQYTATSYQKIGVIYRTALVTAAPIALLFEDDSWAYPRPALSVTITVDGAAIELIGVHLKAGVTTDDAERRRVAITKIDALLRAQTDAGGEDEVILLGDYNEVLTDAAGRAVLAPLLTAPERYTVRTEPAAVAGEISYLGFGGKLIDQITTTAALDARWSAARVEVPRLDGMITSYRSQVSDHLPVILIAPRP
jgi:endonuclease/exonuclease/phosphatase family metal-dependent hydrolase